MKKEYSIEEKDRREKMKIFKKSETVLTYAGFGSSEFVQIIGINVPRPLLRFIIASSLLLAIFLELVCCINGYAEGYLTIMWRLCILFTILSTIIIYIGLLCKRNKILEMFNSLEEVLARSNVLFYSIYGGLPLCVVLEFLKSIFL